MSCKYFLALTTALQLTFGSAFSQSGFSNSGARAAGAAFSGVTFSDHAAAMNNIAGIADVKTKVVSANATKLYSIQGLNTTSLNLVLPAKLFSLSISAMSTGDNFFSVRRFGFGIANKISFVQIGAQVSYLQYMADEFGSGGAFVIDFGGIAELGEKVKFGAHVFNFTQSTIYSEPPEPVPLVMKAGLAYLPFSKLKLLIEVEKEIDLELLKKAGLEYEFVAGVFARTGVTLDPLKNYFGIGFYKKKFLIDYAFLNHNRLGLSHHLSLGYKFSRHE